jgi:hypothetical protein
MCGDPSRDRTNLKNASPWLFEDARTGHVACARQMANRGEASRTRAVSRAFFRWFAIGVICAGSLWSFRASALDPPAIALDYARAPTLADACPDESSFRNLVIARLGYDPFLASAANANDDLRDRVHVELTANHGRVDAAASLTRNGQSPHASRALVGATSECESIVSALATTIAIALDPVHAGAPVTASPPPAPSTIAPSAPAPAPAPAPDSAPPSPPSPLPIASAPLSYFASAAPVVSIGVAPSASFGGEAGFGVARDRFSIEAVARAEAMPGPATVASGHRLTASIFSGSILPCARIADLRVCALLRVGEFEGQAPELATKQPGASLYAALGVRIGYAFRFADRFALEPSIEAAIPLARTSLDISGASVWTAPVASVGGALAIDLFF